MVKNEDEDSGREAGAAPSNAPSSLLPMLISGLVLIVIGMIVAAAFA